MELARRNMKQRRFAEIVGMTPTGVTYVLNGKVMPNPTFAYACETELGVSAERILKEEAETVRRRWLGKRLDELHALRHPTTGEE